ncbi:COP9 signalosome complex subunit 6 [Aphelenchoides bicaudatus]|nr:COP9 signalosome complex subunit 6 [Aphelenchoides bicaudatus]
MESKKETLTAQVHPVSLLIVSNHFTRVSLQNDGKFIPVVGAMLGKQGPHTVEIQNCYEIETKLENDKWVLNETHFKAREEMFQETFPNQTFLGFYVAGDYQNIDDFDKYLYKLASTKTETTNVLLKMSPLIDSANEKIPVNVFEAVFDPQSNQQVLTPVQLKIVSDSAEQISTDHAAKFTSGGDKSETTTSRKLNEQASALKMFSKSLISAVAYLKALKEGKVEADPTILSSLNKLAIKLHFLETGQIKSASDNSSVNDKLIVLHAMNNKISGSVFAIISKLNMIINEHSASPQTPMKRKENF